MKDAITRDHAQLRGALRAIARKSLGVIDFPGTKNLRVTTQNYSKLRAIACYHA
jgi:CTP-dependent riboflavin kinase